MRTGNQHLTRAAGRGQGLVEYALVLVLAGIVLVLALGATEGTLGNIFSGIVDDFVTNPSGRPSAYEIRGPSGGGGGGDGIADRDGDGVSDMLDNCPDTANTDQADTDSDGLGDVCDNTPNGDADNDGVDDAIDNCPGVANATQSDFDADGIGDRCDDSDGDGVNDALDPCPDDATDSCEAAEILETLDSDGDGILDAAPDNCPYDANNDQADADGDGLGDICDDDDDNDGVSDSADNCPLTANANQTDTDDDGEGDACDLDDDGDGVLDVDDNCRVVANPDQENEDRDPQGDACDTDDDNDGILDVNDACPLDPYHDNYNDPCDHDEDGDSIMDSMDPCPADPTNTCFACGDFSVEITSSTSVEFANNSTQNVTITSVSFTYSRQNHNSGPNKARVGSTQIWSIGDGSNAPSPVTINGLSSSIPPTNEPAFMVDFDHQNDYIDSVTVAISNGDNCSYSDIRGGGGIPDADGDGYSDMVDNCPAVANPNQADADNDNIGDACDSCPNDASNTCNSGGGAVCATVGPINHPKNSTRITVLLTNNTGSPITIQSMSLDMQYAKQGWRIVGGINSVNLGATVSYNPPTTADPLEINGNLPTMNAGQEVTLTVNTVNKSDVLTALTVLCQ